MYVASMLPVRLVMVVSNQGREGAQVRRTQNVLQSLVTESREMERAFGNADSLCVFRENHQCLPPSMATV